MFQKNSFKVRTTLLIILFAIVGGIAFSSPAKATIPVADILGSGEGVIEKLWNKAGTILFQNIARKAVNQIAFDYATYLGSGGKGQQPLFVTKDWGTYLKDMGDKAGGDFVQTFANSIVADFEKGGNFATSEKEKALLKQCETARTTCEANGGKNCDDAYDKCEDSVDALELGSDMEEKMRDQIEKCDEKLDTCIASASSVDKCKDEFDICVQKVRDLNSKRVLKNSKSGQSKINICSPSSPIVSMKIGLGLEKQYQNYSVNCKGSDMIKNWTSYADKLSSMSGDDFTKNIMSIYASPYSNDLGIALTANIKFLKSREDAKLDTRDILTANKGWLDARDFAGNITGTPEAAKDRKKLVDEKLMDNMDKVTGDIIVDAANIFLNQLAITAWNNAMGKLSSNIGNISSNGYWSSKVTGRTGLQNRISSIKEPKFSGSGQLDILSKLTICSDEKKPSPTECVINDKFSDAISSQMTLANAIKSGSVPADLPFGFDNKGYDNLSYKQGYPYRSLIILRKYRIIPVGWELAAQKIQMVYSGNATPEEEVQFAGKTDGINLGDLVSCYSKTDQHVGYTEAWCEGLVDPNWVLKVPQYNCASSGYGPNLVREASIEETVNKFCSVDGGISKEPYSSDNKPGERSCRVDMDCCTDSEISTVLNKEDDKGNSLGGLASYRKGDCIASCDYKETKTEVYRANDYCADEQSCVKTGKNGGCDLFGYCTGERRTWVFNTEGSDENCKPIYNTCQIFENEDDGDVAFLENTIDFGNCNVGNVGCQQYSIADSSYNTKFDDVEWSSDLEDLRYFDDGLETCREADEGCSEYIRLIDGGNANLIGNGGFESLDNTEWSKFGSVVYDFADTGNNSFYLDGTNSLNSLVVDMLPQGFEFEKNIIYTFSARVFVQGGGDGVEMSVGNSNSNIGWVTANTASTDEWEDLIITFENNFSVSADFVKIAGMSASSNFFVDNLKLEVGRYSKYSEYGVFDRIYTKMLPEYLEDDCYSSGSNYNLLATAPEKCFEYARKCNQEEVGCIEFTEVETKDKLVAQAKPKDYCPDECVGYDTFIQKETYFHSVRDEYYIADTAKSCQAREVGCSALVNLDNQADGGEGIEYYSYLRQCINRDDKDAEYAEFYTWQGSDESGQQLMYYQLQEDETSNISEPYTVDDDSGTCNETIFNLFSNHPMYNHDCMQFYGRDGNISYHLLSLTVAHHEDCHPYRLVDDNVDVSITSERDCNALAESSWDENNDECIVCLNNGVWDDTQNACVSYGIPVRSTTCSAAAVGCREYAGNFGNNITAIVDSGFENGDDGWENVKITSESINLGGHSAKSDTGKIALDIGVLMNKDSRYVLSFIAKQTAMNNNPADFIMDIDLTNNFGDIRQKFLSDGYGTTKNTATMPLEGSWRQYSIEINNIEHDIESGDKLAIVGDSLNFFYIDNIKILEVNDSHYLIKDSWETPSSCDADHLGSPSPLYMLGCRAYEDQEGNEHNLRSFSKICNETSAGCSAVINTYNSDNYKKELFNDDNYSGTCDQGEDSCFEVPADSMDYITYSSDVACNGEVKGCQRVGAFSSKFNTYTDEYILNNPNKYLESLCERSVVDCQRWYTADGQSEMYFKNPHNNVCEYRFSNDTFSFGWFKKRLSYCEEIGGGQSSIICEKTCDNGMKCTESIADDTPCDVSVYKTIGEGSVVRQPSQNVGLCKPDMATCSEYIDPDSRGNGSLIKGYALGETQDIKIKANTLYILKDTVGTVDLYLTKDNIYGTGDIDDTGDIYSISNTTNELVHSNSLRVEKGSKEFLISDNRYEVIVRVIVNTGEEVRNVVLREAIVNYKLDNTVGEAPVEPDFDKGHILFNKRSQNGSVKTSLVYDTVESYEINSLISGTNNTNANVLLAVQPDRECSEWLACKTYINNEEDSQEGFCYERGLCNELNDNGDCANFVATFNGINQTYGSDASGVNITNMTGYSKVAYEGSKYGNNFLSLGGMRQVGDDTMEFNGSFELGENSKFNEGKDPDIFSVYTAPVLNEPAVIQNEKLVSFMVPDGQSIMKNTSCVSQVVENIEDIEYVFSAYIYLKNGTYAAASVGNEIMYAPNVASGTPVCPFEGGCTANTPTWLELDRVDYTGDGEWVRITEKFNIEQEYLNNSDSIRVGFCTDGVMYVDDVRIEPGLEVKKSAGYGIDDYEYIHSECRIFPTENALSCDYYDDYNVRHKGWKGYCLEHDPRNSAVCLLWYPIDKVASDSFEGGFGLDFQHDLYYCIDGEDQCGADNPALPEMSCKAFVRVDKRSYWRDRLSEDGSDYSQTLNKVLKGDPGFTGDFGVNFGVNSGDDLNLKLAKNSGGGYYGAYSTDELKATQKISAGPVGTDNLGPFFPYYGNVRAGGGENAKDSNGGLTNKIDGSNKDPEYFCRATLDKNGNDRPFEWSYLGGWLGKTWEGYRGQKIGYDGASSTYDECYVGGIAQYNDGFGREDDHPEDRHVCEGWDILHRPGKGRFASKYNKDNTGDLSAISELCLGYVSDEERDASWWNLYRSGGDGFLYSRIANTDCSKIPLDYCCTNDAICLGGQCGVSRIKDVNGDDTDEWEVEVRDIREDWNEPGCFFDCYNHMKDYDVAKDTLQSVEAVKRLWARNKGCYIWEPDGDGGGEYIFDTDCDGYDIDSADNITHQCSGNVRPKYEDKNGRDLCYVNPVVSEFKILGDGLVERGKRIEFVFKTEIDEEQLPFQYYSIKLDGGDDYDLNTEDELIYRVGKLNSDHNPSEFRSHSMWIDYDTIEYYLKSDGSDSYILSPNITITDNWGETSSISSVNDLIVSQ